MPRLSMAAWLRFSIGGRLFVILGSVRFAKADKEVRFAKAEKEFPKARRRMQ